MNTQTAKFQANTPTGYEKLKVEAFTQTTHFYTNIDFGFPGCFCVTHKKSGFSIAKDFETLHYATECMNTLENLTDWSKLKTLTQIQKAKAKLTVTGETLEQGVSNVLRSSAEAELSWIVKTRLKTVSEADLHLALERVAV